LMAAVRLIVCEQSGLWAAALRRTLGAAVELRQTRSLTECGRELAQAGSSLVAVELSADRVTRVAAFVAWISRRVPQALPIVLAERSLAGHEWWLREAGAAHFAISPRGLTVLAEVARRHGRRFPPPAQSWSQRIWATLPWGD